MDDVDHDEGPPESESQRTMRLNIEAGAIGAAVATSALVVGGPVAAIAAGGASAFLTTWHGMRRAASDRAERTVEQGAEAAGLTANQFAVWAESDPRHAALVVAAVEAAARTATEDNVRVLARVLAEGAQDDARVDEDTLLAQVLGRLRPSHVQVLRFLVEGDGPGHHGRKVWDLSPSAEHVLRRLPHLGMAAVPSLAALVAEGCAVSDGGVQHESSRYQATGFGRLCLWALRPEGEAGARPVPPEDPWRE